MKSPDFTPCESMPIIRIAPICNGKVYVIPHSVSPKMDIPFMEQTDIIPAKASNKLARQLMKKYASQISTSEQPRFCVKYNSPVHKDESIYLYILPLKNEKEIHFENGEFIIADDITIDATLYSHYLQKESDLLSMAAELWNDYL